MLHRYHAEIRKISEGESRTVKPPVHDNRRSSLRAARSAQCALVTSNCTIIKGADEPKQNNPRSDTYECDDSAGCVNVDETRWIGDDAAHGQPWSREVRYSDTVSICPNHSLVSHIRRADSAELSVPMKYGIPAQPAHLVSPISRTRLQGDA